MKMHYMGGDVYINEDIDLPFPERLIFWCNTPTTMIMMTISKTIKIMNPPNSPPIIAGNGIAEN